MPTDLVCGMEVGETQYATKSKGKTVYFCCPHCKARYDKTPEKFNA